jgi:ferrochelatase
MFFTVVADSTGERTTKKIRNATSNTDPIFLQFIERSIGPRSGGPEDPWWGPLRHPVRIPLTPVTRLPAQEIGESQGQPVDSILIVSFGGPERSEDVMPFLRNVVRGREVPDSRLAAVAEQYEVFGGRSPINDQNRALIAALQSLIDEEGPHLPIYWGNRNWAPTVTEALQEMATDGRRHAVAFVTSAFSSFSGCRQYKDDITRAREAVGDSAPAVTKIRQFFNHPGFVGPMARNVGTALDALPPEHRSAARLVFTAHSLPIAMAQSSRYQSQLLEAARLVTEATATENAWDLVFQSRSGSPSSSWLEPDIRDHLRALHEKDVKSAVIVPVGFVSDHMEVAYDLDTAAMETAMELGMHVVRARTVGTDPQFVRMVRDLIVEEIDAEPIRTALGPMGAVGCLGDQCCAAGSH